MSQVYRLGLLKGIEARKQGLPRECFWRDNEYQIGWYDGWDQENFYQGISREYSLSR